MEEDAKTGHEHAVHVANPMSAIRYKLLSSVPGNTHLSQLLLRTNYNKFFSATQEL